MFEKRQKLYRAWTIVRRESDNRNIKVNWFCYQREKPKFNYRELIVDYETMDALSKISVWNMVRTFLTVEEIGELRQYLKELYGAEISVMEVPLPIKPGEMDFPNNHNGHLIFLDNEIFYNVSVPIAGSLDSNAWDDESADAKSQGMVYIASHHTEKPGVLFLEDANDNRPF